jgi:exosortase/archaeosortase family protein
MASVVPLAMFGNMVRVIGTVLLVHNFGAEYAEGGLHESFGLMTSLLGTGALLLVARWIE